jgi:hypothetical protein
VLDDGQAIHDHQTLRSRALPGHERRGGADWPGTMGRDVNSTAGSGSVCAVILTWQRAGRPLCRTVPPLLSWMRWFNPVDPCQRGVGGIAVSSVRAQPSRG